MVIVTCNYCGEDVEKQPWQVKRYDVHYCNRDCFAQYRREQGRVYVDCAECGETLHRKKSRTAKYGNQFCGDECQGNWISNNIRGKSHPNWDGGERMYFCPQCEWPVIRHPCMVYNEIGPFCSHSCRAIYHQQGENNSNWSGGRVNYGRGWTKAKREHIRNRQNRKCANCDVHEDRLYRKLDVHHIVPARKIEDPEIRNDPNNLVALCQPCHLETESR